MSTALAGFFALGTGDGTAGFVELTGAPGYARLPVTMVTTTPATVTNTAALNFASNGGAWASVTQQALYDATGDLLFWWQVVPITLADQRPYPMIATGALQLTFPDVFLYPTHGLLQWPGNVQVGTAFIDGVVTFDPSGRRRGSPIMTAQSGTAWSAP